MRAMPEPEEGVVIDESIVISNGNFGIRDRMPLNIFHRQVLRTKTETKPLPGFTFYGETESVEYKKLEGGRVDVIIHLKQKVAP